MHVPIPLINSIFVAVSHLNNGLLTVYNSLQIFALSTFVHVKFTCTKVDKTKIVLQMTKVSLTCTAPSSLSKT